MAGTGTVAPAPKFTAYDNNGAPLSGGKLYVYEAGTSTPATTYSDVGLATPNANPVVLDAGGRATIFLSPGSYKFVQKTSADVTVFTQDNVSSVAPFNVDLDVAIVAGEALTLGQAIYLSDGTGSRTAGRWYLTDADTAAYSTLVITGFATTALAAGETGSARLLGMAVVTGPLIVGSIYYLSGTPGGISTSAGTFVKNMGTANSTTTLIMTVATPVTPGGSNTQVQFNDSGVLGGDSGFTFIKATDAVAIAGATTVGGTLGVTGATTLSSTVATGALTVTGAATVSTTLGVTGATTLSSTVATGALTVTGAATVSTTLGVTGAITSATSVALTGTTNNLGTITSGVWNAGAVTSSGGISGTTGAFSSTVTGGTYNSQTISSAASLTGTLGVAGLLTVSGFGTHSFSAGGTGANRLQVKNTTAGTGNYAAIDLLRDAGVGLSISAFSSTFTTASQNVQGGVSVESNGVGGLSLAAISGSGAIRFYSGGSTERWQMNAGGMFFQGTVSAGSDFVAIQKGSGGSLIGGSGTGAYTIFNFYNANGVVGSITTSGSATAYNTSSDARLKRHLGIATSVDVLQRTVVHDFDWLTDGLRARGVFAQEAYVVIPSAVTVGADDMEDGHLVKPWSVDYSKYVPDLIVGWQQHDARLAAMEAKLLAAGV